jgi:hypothetical protein
MVGQDDKIDKGYRLEELLKGYFLRAGFFVVRAVPFQHAGEDLTDIDLWLYERPTGSSRRRQIVDSKSKTRPKAIERLLWTKGLAQLLDIDGAYVATTDTRPMLREIARKLGISVMDGGDIRRISESERVVYPDRISEENLMQKIATTDRSRRNKHFQLQYHDIKLSLIENFGAGTINRALESFAVLSGSGVTAHPNSAASEIALRLTYFAAAIVAVAIDYINSAVSFRASEERRTALVNAIRFGNSDEATGLETLRLAIALLQKYSGSGEAAAVEHAVRKDLKSIPAEIIAEHVVKNTKQDDLFQIAKRLEHLSHSNAVTSFDFLSTAEKAFVAVLLDYSNIDRVRFASCWNSGDIQAEPPHEGEIGTLFSEKHNSGNTKKP